MLYVTAQHVRSHRTGGDAVHTFLHDAKHVDENLSPEEVLRRIDYEAGELLDKEISPLGQGGNEVLSYLDLLAQEGTSRGAMIEVLDELYRIEPQVGPVVLTVQSIIVRCSVRPDRLQDWATEISGLSSKIEGLLRKAAQHHADRLSSKTS